MGGSGRYHPHACTAGVGPCQARAFSPPHHVPRPVPSAQRVPGEGIEVTSIAWALDGMDQRWRTFAAHLDGSVSEVDWRASTLTAPVDSTGGVVWALATQPVEAVKPGGCGFV